MRPNTNPKVSIIIPCYNLVGYIDTCLNSCMVQTYQNIEILVVNDGSSDGSKEIVDAYAKLDNRIRPIHKHNEGLSLARRTGIFEAAGDYLFFLDGDDFIVIDAIEVLLEKALSSEADIVKGEYSHEADSGYKIQKFDRYGTCSPSDFFRLMLKQRLFTVWGILYSRHIFSEDMDYQGDIKRGEDGPLLALVVNRIHRVLLLEKVVYYYRSRPGSITQEVSLSNFGDAIRARFKIEESALKAGLDKKRDYELGEFICFSVVLYLRHAHAASEIDQKLIKNKIGEYLINNKPFKVYYRKQSRKNYLRLKYFYIMHLPHNLFEWAYKLKLLR
jgi:glycosyltransferase involved in cell wall biosynthesis